MESDGLSVWQEIKFETGEWKVKINYDVMTGRLVVHVGKDGYWVEIVGRIEGVRWGSGEQ